MHFSKSLLRACFVAGKWLFAVTGGLALLSLVSDFMRGDEAGRTDVMLWIGVLCLALAAAFHFGGRFLNSYD